MANFLTGDCPQDYLPYLVEKEIQVGVCTPCANIWSDHIRIVQFAGKKSFTNFNQTS
jgi:hypothetical protein